MKEVTLNRSKRIARISLLTSFAVIGSFITLPGPVSSVALDSTSGYFAALNFGEAEGASVLFLGHLCTAFVHGFPLGFLHIPIALGLALQGWVMAKISKRFGKLNGTIVGIAVNTGLTAVVIPVLGISAAVAITPFILLASLVNGSIAYLVTRSLIRAGMIRVR